MTDPLECSIFSWENPDNITSWYDNAMKKHNEILDKKKEEAKKIADATLNQVEIGFVKFLFKIRNANFYKKIIPYERIFTENPDGYRKRERVFIAGKIFPALNLAYKNEDADATKIKFKNVNSYELELLFGAQDKNLYGSKYISVDDDKIQIFLPKDYSKIVFSDLLLDFLTNGKITAHTIGGEFPDFDTYKLAFRKNKEFTQEEWKENDGCWLTSDRANNKSRWINGYAYIIKHKQLGWLAPFKQIYDFYNAVDGWIFRLGHRVKWCKGAKRLVNSLSVLDGGFLLIDNDVEIILNELNLGICDFAITQFYDLIYGKYATTPLKGNEAYEWDKRFITYEQGTVAPPIYKKTSSATINKFQKMADKDGLDTTNGVSTLGAGSWILNDVTPAFDDFKPEAKVTDDLFRIDLPLLMLYLDTHKINKYKLSPSLKDYLNNDGTVNQKCKDTIKEYVI